MQIWVDADACPNPIKEILFRAAQRVRLPLILVANQPLRTPPSPYIRAVQVLGGFDEADNYIERQCHSGDLVITADIPLAAAIIEKEVHVLNPRGERYTPENIQQRLAMRNYMDEIRSTGAHTGGPSAMGQGERQAFANALDSLLRQYAGASK